LACSTEISQATPNLDATVQAAIDQTRTLEGAAATSGAATATAETPANVADAPEPTATETPEVAPSATETTEAAPTNTPQAPTPTSPPPSAPTPTPTEEKILIAQSDVDGDDGNDFLTSSSESNQGRVVLLPGFDPSEVTDPVVFRDRMVFRVEVFDTRAGQVDGAGIQDVTFRIEADDDSGQIVYEKQEKTPSYCVFGGGEPDCNVLTLEDGSQWPNSYSADIQNGTYLAKIDILPVDGEPTQWRWRFNIEIHGQTTSYPADNTARINAISVQDGRYIADFETFGFEPMMPGQHVHFFFNSVSPEEAGVPGSGPWQIYPTGPGEPNTSPFTLYSVDQRPEGATQMCILVANEDHSVNQGTGNCVDLP
jgi:hypothetical protein